MPTRSQFLVYTGFLATGMIFGALATMTRFPAVPAFFKATPKVSREKSPAVLPIDPPVAKEAPKVDAPAVAVAAAVPHAKEKERVAEVVVPAEKIAAKVDPVAGKLSPDDVLRRKGLERAGPVYVLEAENDLRRGIESLIAISNRWDITVLEMNQTLNLLARCQHELEFMNSTWGRSVLAAGAAGPWANLDAVRTALREGVKGETAPATGKESGSKEKEKKEPEGKKHPRSRPDDKGLNFIASEEPPSEHFMPGGQPGNGGRMTGGQIPSRQWVEQGGQMPGEHPWIMPGQHPWMMPGLHPGMMPGNVGGGGPSHMEHEQHMEHEHHMVPEAPRERESEPREPHESKRLYVILPGRLQLKAAQNVRPTQNARAELLAGMQRLLWTYYNLETQMLGLVQQFQWQSLAVRRQALELEGEYERLRNEDDVLAALEELNRTENPRVTLGSLAKYRENLAKMTERLLRNEGVLKDLKGNFQFSIVAVFDYHARQAADKLRNALDAQRKMQIVVKDDKIRLESATRSQNADGVANQLTKLRKDKSELDAISLDVAAKREVYIQAVTAFRRVVDEAQSKAPELERTNQVSIGRINPQIFSHLESLEETITRSVVVLKPDKTIFWIKAVLNEEKGETAVVNGKKGETAVVNVPNEGKGQMVDMVLEPTVDLIRMSSDSAARLGIKPDGLAIPEVVTLAGGRKLAAKRVTLKTVRVGTFSAEDVDCLVIPEGFEEPPQLGADFLNRFSFRFNSDAEKVSLTQVELSPPKRK